MNNTQAYDNDIQVVLIRHAQSTWNAQTRFTGWANPPLTELGVDEAKKAGHILAKHHYVFDQVFTSELQRAKHTAQLILEETQQTDVPQYSDWRLNERHYGTVQGLNKDEMGRQVGEEQVWRWRRGYLDKSEAMRCDDQRHPRFNELFNHVPADRLPAVENLAETQMRAVEFWQEVIVPVLKEKKRVLVSSHGNTLRALIMALDNMTVEEVEKFEIPTGTPIVYTLSADGTPKHWAYLKE